MKIPTPLRRPFYNKSEIRPPSIPPTIALDAAIASSSPTIKPDTTIHPHDKPVSFFHPSLRKVRNRAYAKWLLTTACLMAFILAVLSIFWGVFLRIEDRVGRLRVLVVDMDDGGGGAPFVGPAMVRVIRELKTPTLGWDVVSGDVYGGDPVQVRRAVYEWEAWAALVVNPNASSALRNAVTSGDASYEPIGACQLVYQDARDQTNWYDFIAPVVNQVMVQVQSEVGREWARMLLDDEVAGGLEAARSVPQAVNPAVGFSVFNLRPFYPHTAIPAVSIGLIYLIIISFFSFSFYMPIHAQYLNPRGHPPLKFPHLILWRWLATLSAYIFLSLAYSLVSLAFQINFTKTSPVTATTQPTPIEAGNSIAYGAGTFPVYWALNFFAMCALGLACENAAMILGAPWMGLFLIFWVISNVSTAFYDVELAPKFYRWGYGWPLHYVVEASRQILFGLHSRIGLDFGVLVAWAAVNSGLFPVCCWVQRWKGKKGVQEYWSAE